MNEEPVLVKCGCGGKPLIRNGEFLHTVYIQCPSCGIRTVSSSKNDVIGMWNKAMGITHEKAIEYLQESGWMEDHDYQMMEIGKEMAGGDHE